MRNPLKLLNYFKNALFVAVLFILLPMFVGGLFSGCEGCAQRRPTPHQKAMQRRRALKKAHLTAKPVDKKSKKRAVRLIHDTELTVQIPYMPLHLNPYLKISEWGYKIAMGNIFESLVQYDLATSRITPLLAESWDVDGSGKVYRFTLRRGMRWQDGRPITVEDVRFSFMLLQAPRIKRGPFLQDIMYDLMRVDIVGPRSVRVVLRNPNIFFLERVSELPIMPAHLYARAMKSRSRLSRKPIGSGPFRFLEYKNDREIVLIRNDFYWGSAPQLTRITFRVYDDDARALVAVRRRELDIMPDVPASYYPDQFTQSILDDYRILILASPDFGYLLWNTKDPVLGDFRVRRALTMLINRKKIIQRIFHGLAEIPKGPFFPDGGWGDPNLKPWPYDPVQARKLLTDMGWVDSDGNGIRDKGKRELKLVILYPVDSRIGKRILGIVKDEFIQSGISVILLPTAWNMLKSMLRKGRFSGAFLAWRGRVHEDFSQLFHSTGRYNFGVISNIFLDKTLTHLRKGMGRPADFTAKIERILHAYVPVTFLYRPKKLVLFHRRLGKVHVTPLGIDYKNITVNRNYWLQKLTKTQKSASNNKRPSPPMAPKSPKK